LARPGAQAGGEKRGVWRGGSTPGQCCFHFFFLAHSRRDASRSHTKMAATPASAARGHTATTNITGPCSWTADLDAYAAACAAAASGPAAPPVAVVAAALRTAGRLGAALRSAPTSADAWWAFLAHEEAFAMEAASLAPAARRMPLLGALPPHPAGRPAAARLLRLYEAATRAVPRGSGGAAFARIWLGYARRQW
jgi:hypothetical protein